MSENDLPVGEADGPAVGGGNAAQTHTLTKQDIDKMIDHLKEMEGKVVVKGKPINLNNDAAAWYIAYGT